MPSGFPLTEEDRAMVFDFIRNHIAEEGYAPTVREIAEECEIAVGAAHNALEALERAGLIQRRPHSPRALRVVR